MVAPRHHATRLQPAAMRAAVYARLEEIPFRTGMAVLTGVIAIVGGAIAAVLIATQGGPAARTPASLASQIPIVLPQSASAAPSASPPRPRPRPRPGRRAVRQASHHAAAGIPAAGVPAAVARPPARRVQPARRGHGRQAVPGWWWQWVAWEQRGHGGWPHGERWQTPPGWPHAARWGPWPGNGAPRAARGGD